MDERIFHNLIIPGWMVFRLQLNYSELRVYALIYGFSQGGNGCFHGSMQYLADWCGISNRQNVPRVLRKLMNKGLIFRQAEKYIDKFGRVRTRYAYLAKMPDLTADCSILKSQK